MLTEDVLLSKVMLGILCCAALFLFCVALYKKVKRQWDSIYFVLLCAAVFVWSAFSLLALLIPSSAEAFNLLRMIGIILIPALLCLHVRQQISYKELHIAPVIMLLIIPLLLIYVICQELFLSPAMSIPLAFSNINLHIYIFGLYAAIALISSHVLCFSVFYKMPRRTRRSTRYMLVGVSTVSFMFVMAALWVDQLSFMIPHSVVLRDTIAILAPLFVPAALLILLYSLFNALYVMPASEVIVTSREFVVGGLSTTILILNRKEEIIDWNRTDWGTDYPLPMPLFKEPISEYRQRMLTQSICRVSPHSNDIIIAKQGDEEKHFLLLNHEAKNSKRLFGYVLEISEVTQLYTLMRYFEQIARYDQLTGLFNRNAYMHRVKLIAEKENLPLLILVGDVNLLKRINDIHGHMLGDELLTIVAGIIKQAVPENAFAARVGGDEFVVLVPKGSTADADQFINKIRQLCAEVKHEIIGTPSISWG